MKTALKGVNLGGWLVLEPWITPSLFAGTEAPDEFTYCQHASTGRLVSLKRFRDSFITLEDFQWLAAQGIEVVRIPVGYWLFGDETPYQATVEYLDNAFKWAEATGLMVLISLHGVRGSQNGKMHSGREGEVAWPIQPANLANTLEVVHKIAERYQKSPALWGISLLNEPSRLIPKRFITHYYRQAYQIIRQICGEGVYIVISDGLQPWRWLGTLLGPRYRGVLLDLHLYRAFKTKHKAMSAIQHIVAVSGVVTQRLGWLARLRPYIVGEWSAALDQGSLQALTEVEKAQTYRQYYDAQMLAFDSAAAQCYWTYKTEDRGVWSYRDLVTSGL